ncbi:hypothetical protein SBADM41S_10842 [Streptomyces badius]
MPGLLVRALQGQRRDLTFDPELLYVGALFHDLGLGRSFRSSGRRFEVDSADEARRFLRTHGVPEDSVRRVWTAIALHTTPGIPSFMEPEVALVTAGVEYDVLGIGYEDLSPADRRRSSHSIPGRISNGESRCLHRRDPPETGDDVRQRQGRRPGALRSRLRTRRLRPHHSRLPLARVTGTARPHLVAVVAFDGVQLLDVTGPAEVFTTANGHEGATTTYGSSL